MLSVHDKLFGTLHEEVFSVDVQLLCLVASIRIKYLMYATFEELFLDDFL